MSSFLFLKPSCLFLCNHFLFTLEWFLKPPFLPSPTFSSVQLLSRVRLFATPWIAARQAPLCPWNSPGKNTGVGSYSLFQGIFLTQGLNLGPPHCRQILCHLSHQGSPWPGIKLPLLALEGESLNHWTAREVPVLFKCLNKFKDDRSRWDPKGT